MPQTTPLSCVRAGQRKYGHWHYVPWVPKWHNRATFTLLWMNEHLDSLNRRLSHNLFSLLSPTTLEVSSLCFALQTVIISFRRSFSSSLVCRMHIFLQLEDTRFRNRVFRDEKIGHGRLFCTPSRVCLCFYLPCLVRLFILKSCIYTSSVSPYIFYPHFLAFAQRSHDNLSICLSTRHSVLSRTREDKCLFLVWFSLKESVLLKYCLFFCFAFTLPAVAYLLSFLLLLFFF